MISKYHFFLFDLDNCLIHTNINFVLLKRKLSHFITELHENSTSYDQQIVQNHQNFPIGVLLDHIKKRNPIKYHQALKLIEDFERKGIEGANIDPDVIPTLKQLKMNDIKLAVVTNNQKKITELLLRRFNLFSLFDVVVTRDDVNGKLKPNPASLNLAMQKLHADRRYSVFIGDSKIDAAAAQNAKIAFICIGKCCEEIKKQYSCIATITKISDLLDLLSENT